MKHEKPPEEIWIDKQDIMQRIHISNRTLQTWRSKGILPYARIGRKIYYKESDFSNLLNAGENNIQILQSVGNALPARKKVR